MRVALATTLPLPEVDADQDLMLEAFRRAGFECELLGWDSGDDPNEWDAVILRSTWNYHLKPDEFLNWTRSVDRLFNDAATVESNVDKRYLVGLEDCGVATVPTVFCDQAASVQAIADEQGWTKFVVKPSVGASSYGTGLFDSGDPSAQAWFDNLLGSGTVMIQPFVESVNEGGERALVWIDGEFTHKIVKQPRFSDDEESVSQAEELTAPELEIGHKALEGFSDLLYARVDVMELDGKPVVSELELVEPSLYFRQNPAALDRMVEAVAQRLS